MVPIAAGCVLAAGVSWGVGWVAGYRSGIRLERGLWLEKAQRIGVDVSDVLPTKADVAPPTSGPLRR